MFEIHGNDIYTNRGESVTLNITPVDDAGDVYVMEVNDRLRLGVYEHCGARRMLFEAESQPGYTQIIITPDKTERLDGTYDYNVKLIYADGSSCTIIGQTANFMPHFIVLGRHK